MSKPPILTVLLVLTVAAPGCGSDSGTSRTPDAGGAGGDASAGTGGAVAAGGTGGASGAAGAGGTGGAGAVGGSGGAAGDAGGADADAGSADADAAGGESAGADAAIDAATDVSTDAAADAPSDGGRADAASEAGMDGGDAGVCRPELGQICESDVNFAFLTSAQHELGSLGSVEAADAICNDTAKDAGLPGTYVAWLSSASSDARTRLGSASGWIRVDRRPFAASADDLYASNLLYPLETDAHGDRVTVTSGISTGTQPDGTAAIGAADKANCSGWSNTGDRAAAGWPYMGSVRWTSGGLGSCGMQHIYCLGVDFDSGYTVTPVAGRLAFLSAATFTPDAGLAAADAQCQGEADTKGKPGTFHALLASKSASAISRFDTDGSTWVRPDGIPVFASAADIAAGQLPLAPINVRLDGSYGGNTLVWTGATSATTTSSDQCDDWGDATTAFKGYTGSSDEVSAGWFRGGPWDCDHLWSLYCFQE